MKCPKPDCGVENRDGAKFCRACGTELIKSEVPVMEKFPEYSFSPTSITKIKGSSGIPELILMIITGSILAATLEQFELGLVGGLCILIPFSVIMFIVYFKRVSDIDLSPKFDYVETTNNKTYKFVIKNSKFGVFDVKSRRLAIPCEYDYLKWKSQDNILTATIGRDVFDIDIHGNKLK